MSDLIDNALINDIKTILRSAKNRVYQTINTTMTKTYWEIGRRIVEEEQGGEQRAKYGKALIKNLSLELTQDFGKGFFVDNLENMRKFYTAYPKSETVFRKFEPSLSHYIFLVRVANEDERDFYEIESTQNSWSLRELKRQFNSSLFEHLKTVEIFVPKDKELLEQNTNIFKDIVTKTFSNHTTIKTLESMRDTLLPKLMSGEVRVKYE